MATVRLDRVVDPYVFLSPPHTYPPLLFSPPQTPLYTSRFWLAKVAVCLADDEVLYVRQGSECPRDSGGCAMGWLSDDMELYRMQLQSVGIHSPSTKEVLRNGIRMLV
jgi:hypothetical protein